MAVTVKIYIYIYSEGHYNTWGEVQEEFIFAFEGSQAVPIRLSGKCKASDRN
jgi:hypothetical protein